MNPRIGSQPSVGHLSSLTEEKKPAESAATADTPATTEKPSVPPRQNQPASHLGAKWRSQLKEKATQTLRDYGPQLAAELAPHVGQALEKAALATPQGRVVGTLLKGASIAVQLAPHVISFANSFTFSKDPAERKKMEEELERNPEMGEQSVGPGMTLKDEMAFAKKVRQPGFH